MKKMLFILLVLLPLWAMANEVKIEINPAKPVAGEAYQAFFRIFTEFDGEPVINFTPYKAEVIGKSNQGVTTRTVYSNGRLTTTREMTVVYELSSSDPGGAGLREITIQLGGKTIRHPAIGYNVLKEPAELGEVFLMADVPKKSVYIGEGIVVRYYLYSKVPISRMDVKRYPKLNGFLKRFLQEPERVERVSVDGEIYNRSLIYGAKLFPEKLGDLKIDPLHMTAEVLMSRGGDPFGSLGFGREIKSKTLASESIKIEVRPVPEPRPPHFTGLIGRHEFDLQINQSRLIVNEPLEVKLTISGVGALENLEAPVIISNPALEEFESNGDLKVMNADQATKVFDYTFLAKSELNLPASTLTLSYFDPETSTYVPFQLPIPQLVIVTGGQVARPEKKKESPGDDRSTSKKPDSASKSLSGSMLEGTTTWVRRALPYVNMGLAVFAVFLALGLVIKKNGPPILGKDRIPGKFKKGNFDLGEFSHWIAPLILKTGKTPLNIIREAPLSESGRTYFIDLLSSNDYKDYSMTKGKLDFEYRSQYFKELDRYIRKEVNEDHSKPA